MTTTAGLALPFHGPRDTARTTRDRIEILSQEVGSGRSSDPGRALTSDFSDLSHVSHKLHGLQAVRESLARAQTWGAALQTSLAQIGEAGARVTSALTAGFSGSDGNLLLLAETGRAAAEDIGGVLQRTVGGRAIFANGAADGPLASVQSLIETAHDLAANAVDFESYIADLDALFAVGGGYEASGLTSFSAVPVRFPAGDGETASFDIDATDQTIRDALKQAVLVAGLGGAVFDLHSGASSKRVIDLQTRAAEIGMELPLLQGRIGVVEERIAVKSGEAEVAMQDAELAVAGALSVDPFDAATRLQNEMARVEALYTITARRAQLRLTDYL